MKKQLLKLAVVLFLVSGSFIEFISMAGATNEEDQWKAPPFAARKRNPIESSQTVLSQGRELYQMACLPCHGEKGKGDGPAAASLEKEPGDLSDPNLRQQSDGAIFWKISHGKAPMPAFNEALTEEQRWLIVNFVRTLAPKLTTTSD